MLVVTSYLLGLWLVAVTEATGSYYHETNQNDTGTDLSRTRRFLLKPAYLWPEAVVPYIIENSALLWKTEIERVIAHVEDQSCVRFTTWSTANIKKYGLNHQALVSFIKGDGCFSSVGFSQNGVRTSCCTGEACLHEIGHALGFSHEQNYRERTGWIDVNLDVVPDENKIQYQGSSSDMYDYSTPYDISTMMHYFPVEFTKGKPAYSKDFPELPIAQQYFYHFKEMSNGYKCHEKPQCQGSDLGCENEGYQTVQHGVCKCVCPTGLDPDDKCRTPLKQVTSASWPKGQYAILKPKSGCPSDENFKKGTVMEFGDEGNSMYSRYLAGVVKDVQVELHFCTRTKADDSFGSEEGAKFNWPLGTYCIFQTGGHCPTGFDSRGINYTVNLHATNGDVPDFPMGQMKLCCQFRGFPKEPASFPTSKPFTLLSYPKTKCQKVTGMRSTRESFTIASSTKISAHSSLYPWIIRQFKAFTIPVCHYTPVYMNCGGVIILTKKNPVASIEINSDGRPNLECTWLIKGDTDKGTMVLDFEKFNVNKKDGSKECQDKVEVRHAMLGQFGLDYCGKVGHSIRSITDKMMIRFFTKGKSVSSFKARVKWIPFDEMCYDVEKRGVSYDGNIDYTRTFEPCVPWAQMTECPHNPFVLNRNEQVRHLIGNACRNPDNSFRPWCYTNKAGCQRNYCDVCGLERPYDHDDNCQKLKTEGFCTREYKKAIQFCAATCFDQLPTKPLTKKYSDVRCVKPSVPSDGGFVGKMESSYTIGQQVQFECRKGNSRVSSMCMSSGQWSKVNTACQACPPNYIIHEGTCYGLAKNPSATTYKNALDACQQEGGTLAAPRNLEESKLILQFTQYKHTWMGIHDKKTEGQWVYENDGKDIVWKNWDKFEPNNIRNEDCAAVKSNFKWLDIGCFYRYNFVCAKNTWVNSECNDALGEDQCQGFISDRPSLCKDFPDFVRNNCRESCGVCSKKRVMCPILAGLKPYVEPVSTSSPAVEVGETTRYRCSDSKYPIGGDEMRTCLPSGKLGGESLNCADCPVGFVSSGNACHGLLVGKLLTFREAQDECRNIDGFVAMPRTDEENDIISKVGLGEKIWIGATDIDTEKYFVLEDGSSAYWTDWTRGEPKMVGDKYDCVLMNEMTMWVNVNCEDLKLMTVCTIVTSNADMCYNTRDGGTTYDGNVNYTRTFQPCLPWSKVTHCPSHAFSKGTELANLVGNACRNPDESYRPWCYTHIEDCKRNYCDVCGNETPRDSRDDCDKFKLSGLCTTDAVTAMQQCPATCKDEMPNGKNKKVKYSEIHCGPPKVPSDGTLVSRAKTSYNVGDTVQYLCVHGTWGVYSGCLTSGQWSKIGYTCPECPPGFTIHGDRCYIFMEERSDYQTAMAGCKEKGAQVAVPKTKEEAAYLMNMRQNLQRLWVGLSDEKKEGIWIDQSGKAPAWTNWFIGEPNSKRNENCAYMVLLGKWLDVSCSFKSEYVCSVAKFGNRSCDDFLTDQCPTLLSEEPKMCKDHPDFARQNCAKTCGLCAAGSKKSCSLPKDSALVLKISKTQTIATGDYVEYGCSTGTYRIGGNPVRACLPNGKLTGEHLKCSDCPAGFTLVANSCFGAVQGKVITFLEARKECNKMGGFVAIPKSLAENDIISKLGGGKLTWVGATDTKREGLYEWEDGTLINWINWAGGHNANSDTKDCVAINENKKWNRFICDARMNTVCSIPMEGRNCKYTYNDICYTPILNGKHVSYNDAVSGCEMMGGTLASPRNKAEAVFIRKLLTDKGNYHAMWLGITDKKEEGTWAYPDGSKVGWTNWQTAEPNDRWITGEDCIVMTNVKWIDVPCDSFPYPAVCAVKQLIPASEILCDSPVPPSDAAVVGVVNSKYYVGDTVEFKCKIGGFSVFSRCMTNHLWSDTGFACLSCPGTFFEGRCYTYVNKPFNYEGARSYCKTAGTYLVAPKSQVEADFVAKMMNGSMLWIGITDRASDGDWVYEDGTKLVWTNWNPGEPNNYGKDEEDCAIMVYHTRWIDVQCKYHYMGAICVKDVVVP